MDKWPSKRRARGALWMINALLACGVATPVQAGPGYEFTKPELEAVLQDLIAWLPGAWDSYPQIHYQRRVGARRRRARSLAPHVARIDAPQIGPVVFYGQISIGGRDGPLLDRSQILYVVEIDEQRSAVNMNGQGPLDPEKFVNLHERPELWSQVRMRDRSSIKCDFLWRRDGTQLFAILDGKTEERRRRGPGSCTYNMANTDVEFYADAEWVLSPDDLWDYDINTIAGRLFVGREDRLHIRLFRSSGYRCMLRDADGEREWHAHNRGARTPVRDGSGAAAELMLLRAPMPSKQGPGLEDRLRLLLKSPGVEQPRIEIEAAATATEIGMNADGVDVTCRSAADLPPLTPPPAG
ncbi:MAG: hypothetical protein R3E65_09360 [Steroidobacteraceae bacterium]